MKRSFLVKVKEFFANRSRQPWACFETAGIDAATGAVAFSISWNHEFIKNLHAHGFHGTTDEESVQMFFLSARMIPEELVGSEDAVNPSATPNLTSEANRLVR